MQKVILLFLSTSFLIGCSSNIYNKDFIGTWKNQRTIANYEKIFIEEADDNQLRLKIQYSRHSSTMLMIFKDETTIESTQDFMGVKFIYKLKEEDGKTILVDYVKNEKFNKLKE